MSNSNYAIISGGSGTGTSYSILSVAYSEELSRTIPDTLFYNRTLAVGCSSNNYALIAGGRANSSYFYNSVESYDINLTHSLQGPLNDSVYSNASATVLDDIIFIAGGRGDTGFPSGNVTAYVTMEGFLIEIPAFSKYYFNGITSSEQITTTRKTMAGSQALNGYIKACQLLSGSYS